MIAIITSLEFGRIGFGVLVICLCVYFQLFLCVAKHKESDTAVCLVPILSKKCIILYTDREKTILPILAIIAFGFILFEILNILFGDDYYAVIPLSRLMIFLQFLEKQIILGWMLHEQAGDPAQNVILRIIATSGSLLIAFVFIVFSVFEEDILLQLYCC